MNVRWKNAKTQLYFGDLKPRQTFKIVSATSKGAVYMKCEGGGDLQFYSDDGNYYAGGMLEIMTGKVFPPTLSAVEIVETNLDIPLEKPEIYS